MRLAWAKGKELKSSKFILLGVPDESGSKANRKGTSIAPNRIRKVSNERDMFSHMGGDSLAMPQLCKFDPATLYDMGNIKKQNLSTIVSKIFAANQFPIILGGDHSITFEVLKALPGKEKEFSIIYLDAHPDIVCSERRYYGSVICDVRNLKAIDFKHSLLIGVRAAEMEELGNIKTYQIPCVTSLEVLELGVTKLVKQVSKFLTKKIYLSIDMDVIDPAYAPGVSTPVPGGLRSLEVMYLCKQFAGWGLIGLDIMQVSPPQDISDATSHLAAKLLMETISCVDGGLR